MIRRGEFSWAWSCSMGLWWGTKTLSICFGTNPNFRDILTSNILMNWGSDLPKSFSALIPMVEGLRDHPALGFWEVSHSKIIDHYIHTLHFHFWNHWNFITENTGWEFFDKNIVFFLSNMNPRSWMRLKDQWFLGKWVLHLTWSPWKCVTFPCWLFAPCPQIILPCFSKTQSLALTWPILTGPRKKEAQEDPAGPEFTSLYSKAITCRGSTT